MSELVKTITVGEETRELGVKWENVENQPNIPEDRNDNFRKLILKIAGHDKEDIIIKDAVYSDYPRITIDLGEHVSLVSVLKGKADSEGVLEMPAIEPNVYVSYDKDGGFYTNKDDKGSDGKEIGQFNMLIKFDDGYEIDTATGSDATVYKNIKINDGGNYTPAIGEAWINATQVKGSFTISVTAKEHVEPEPEPEETPAE